LAASSSRNVIRVLGRRIHVSLSISPIKNEKGTITGASTIAVKLMNRKKAVEYLVEPVEKYRKFVDSLAKEDFESEQ
jgi:hypothetical protein